MENGGNIWVCKTASIQMLNILCLCPNYAMVIVFQVKVYKTDQCLPGEPCTTKTGFTVSLFNASFPCLFLLIQIL